MADIKHIVREEDGKLPKYAWPGGYTISYICADNGTLCAECANNPDNPITVAPDDENTDSGWHIIGFDIEYAEPGEYVTCDHCNKVISEGAWDDTGDTDDEEGE